MGLGKLHLLSDDDLLHYTITVAAALSNQDDEYEDSHHNGVVFEAVCPAGSKPGDLLDVQLPPKLGTGRVRTSIPAGVRAGESFDIYPERLIQN